MLFSDILNCGHYIICYFLVLKTFKYFYKLVNGERFTLLKEHRQDICYNWLYFKILSIGLYLFDVNMNCEVIEFQSNGLLCSNCFLYIFSECL